LVPTLTLAQAQPLILAQAKALDDWHVVACEGAAKSLRQCNDSRNAFLAEMDEKHNQAIGNMFQGEFNQESFDAGVALRLNFLETLQLAKQGSVLKLEAVAAEVAEVWAQMPSWGAAEQEQQSANWRQWLVDLLQLKPAAQLPAAIAIPEEQQEQAARWAAEDKAAWMDWLPKFMEYKLFFMKTMKTRAKHADWVVVRVGLTRSNACFHRVSHMVPILLQPTTPNPARSNLDR